MRKSIQVLAIIASLMACTTESSPPAAPGTEVATKAPSSSPAPPKAVAAPTAPIVPVPAPIMVPGAHAEPAMADAYSCTPRKTKCEDGILWTCNRSGKDASMGYRCADSPASDGCTDDVAYCESVGLKTGSCCHAIRIAPIAPPCAAQLDSPSGGFSLSSCSISRGYDAGTDCGASPSYSASAYWSAPTPSNPNACAPSAARAVSASVSFDATAVPASRDINLLDGKVKILIADLPAYCYEWLSGTMRWDHSGNVTTIAVDATCKATNVRYKFSIRQTNNATP